MACLLARISSSFHLQWFTLMWTGCQGISKLTKVAKIAKNTKFRQIGCWLTYLTLMACLLRFLLRSIYILQWITMIWISKEPKWPKKPNITKFRQNWLVHLALMACYSDFLFPSSVNLPWCGQAVKGYQKWVYDYRVAPRESTMCCSFCSSASLFPPKTWAGHSAVG